MPREVFVAGQVLTAAELNVVSDQTVMTFAGTAARGSAIPTPVEGMISYLEDTNQWEGYTTAWGPLGRILQVVSTTKTDTFTTSSTTFGDVTGLSVSITPSSTSSKIFVSISLQAASNPANAEIFVRIMRDSTALGIGDTAGSRERISAQAGGAESVTASVLDSPNSTSSLTYKIQIKATTANAVYVNRSVQDNDNNTYGRAASTITVWEVAG